MFLNFTKKNKINANLQDWWDSPEDRTSGHPLGPRWKERGGARVLLRLCTSVVVFTSPLHTQEQQIELKKFKPTSSRSFTNQSQGNGEKKTLK